MLACLILQSVFLVQNSVAVIVQDGRTFDLYSGLVLAAVVAIFHIVFILVIAIKVPRVSEGKFCGTNEYSTRVVTNFPPGGVVADPISWFGDTIYVPSQLVWGIWLHQLVW